MSAAVEIAGLHKVYAGTPPVRAVDGVDLVIEGGEVFGLLGPNGAGKTTTVGVCTTRIRATSGRVHVAGVDVAAHPAQAKRTIGVVTQFNTLDRSCSIRENLYLHCRFFAMGRRDSWARADELLDRFRLTDRAGVTPYELSGGMAQRVQLARAVAHHPQVVFLDEPTAGLDPQSRLALWGLLGELQREGVTVLLTTHYMEEADALCDRVAVVDHGRVLACDTPDRLKRSTGASTVLELSLDRVDGLAGRLGTLPGVTGVEPTERGLRVLASAGEGLVPAVVEAALGSGLRDLSIMAPSLETVFIQLTGRDLRD